MAKISSKVVDDLKQQIDAVTADPEGIPGTVYCAVNKDGDLIFQHASGVVGKGKQEKMTMDSVFWIASCTKMITGIACMQLVEQGKLSLDDGDQVEKLAPYLAQREELARVQVIDGSKLVPKKRKITLRMLLSHTAGFGYSFFDPRLNDFFHPTGLDEFSGLPYDYFCQPLVNQPGEQWEYGINIDWAGQLVERVSGMKLNDYFQKHILQPMGLKTITMFPTEEMKKNLAYMHARTPEGKLMVNPNGHLNRRPLLNLSKEEIDGTFHSGGAGSFAKPAEYCQIIAMLLNDGTHPKTGAKILKPETVKEMFTNQIPEMPNFGRQSIEPPKPELSNALPELYPQPHDQAQGWGLTFFLHVHPGPTGRSGSTGWWAGLPNLFWWCDRENGLGGIIASQIIPFGDMKVMGLWGQIEAGLYQGIKGQ